MITICVYLGLLRRWNTRVQRFACNVQWKDRLDVEISQTGEKQSLIFVKIEERLRFACIWAYFDAGKRVNYIPHV